MSSEPRGDEVGDEGHATGDAVFGVGTIRLRDGESMVDDAVRAEDVGDGLGGCEARGEPQREAIGDAALSPAPQRTFPP